MRPNQVKFSVMLADINSTFSFFNKSTNFFKNNLKIKINIIKLRTQN